MSNADRFAAFGRVLDRLERILGSNHPGCEPDSDIIEAESLLRELREARSKMPAWMQDATQMETLAKELESRGWRPDSKGEPDCWDQACAMAAEAVRYLMSHPPPAPSCPEGWRDISAAPRDGTWIQLTGGTINYGWDGGEKPSVVAGQYTTELNGREVEGHWQFAWYDGGYYGEYEKPTHWRQLPAAPSAPGVEGGSVNEEAKQISASHAWFNRYRRESWGDRELGVVALAWHAACAWMLARAKGEAP